MLERRNGTHVMAQVLPRHCVGPCTNHCCCWGPKLVLDPCPVMIHQLDETKQAFFILISNIIIVKASINYKKTSACLVFWSSCTESVLKHCFSPHSQLFSTRIEVHLDFSQMLCEDALPSLLDFVCCFGGMMWRCLRPTDTKRR